jgi:hypothetical protein
MQGWPISRRSVPDVMTYLSQLAHSHYRAPDQLFQLEPWSTEQLDLSSFGEEQRLATDDV